MRTMIAALLWQAAYALDRREALRRAAAEHASAEADASETRRRLDASRASLAGQPR